jgi:hypothetical protein
MQHDIDDQKYEMNILVRQKNGDVSIAIGALADMDRLPDFDKMVAHPALLVPQNIPVDEDAILPYFQKSCGGHTRRVQCNAIYHGTQHSVS